MLERLFPRNEGTADRAIRVFFGIALVSLVFVGPRTAWGWLGLVPLVTGLLGSCPVYTLLGIRTCPVRGR
jgi:fatty acid desaturase